MKKEEQKQNLYDRDIPLWKIQRFIREYANNDKYKEDCKTTGGDSNSKYDQGFDHALELLKEELIKIAQEDPYK